jgi:hypothetical protein
MPNNNSPNSAASKTVSGDKKENSTQLPTQVRSSSEGEINALRTSRKPPKKGSFVSKLEAIKENEEGETSAASAALTPQRGLSAPEIRSMKESWGKAQAQQKLFEEARAAARASKSAASAASSSSDLQDDLKKSRVIKALTWEKQPPRVGSNFSLEEAEGNLEADLDEILGVPQLEAEE